jgi:hypothetical protein
VAGTEPFLELGLELTGEVAGLDEKDVGASRRAESARSYAVIRGYHEDDGGGVKLLEAARHLGPVEMGQVQIHQNELRGESGGIE